MTDINDLINFVKSKTSLTSESWQQVIKALENAKANEGKFDVLDKAISRNFINWLNDRRLQVSDNFLMSTLAPAIKELESFKPTLESQLIDGYYMCEVPNICKSRPLWFRKRSGHWYTHEGMGAQHVPTAKPQTDDNGKPILCGPLKNGD